MRTSRVSSLAILSAVLALTSGAAFMTAQGGNIRRASVILEPSKERAGDTLRVIGKARVTGQVDSTCYVWTLPTVSEFQPVRRCYIGKREVDTLYVLRPTTARPLTLAPLAYFKNKVSEAKNVTITVSPYNWPAPVIDSLKIDTLPKADSAQVNLFRIDGTPLATDTSGRFYMKERDTVVAVAVAWKNNAPVPRQWLLDDPVTWQTIEATPGTVKLVQYHRGANDTVLLIALNCHCKESGDAANPPTLVPGRNGLKYSVRDTRGQWRPVTPLAADPFRAAP